MKSTPFPFHGGGGIVVVVMVVVVLFSAGGKSREQQKNSVYMCEWEALYGFHCCSNYNPYSFWLNLSLGPHRVVVVVVVVPHFIISFSTCA